MPTKDHNRQHIVLLWLFRTVITSVVILLMTDNVVVIINRTGSIAPNLPLWRRILVDILLPALYCIFSGIELNKKLAEYDKRLAINRQRQKTEKEKQNETIAKNRGKDPLDFLEEQAEAFRMSAINDPDSTDVDWEYLDGKNKERFTEELAELSKLKKIHYQRTILYVWDRLISIYNKVREHIDSLDDQQSEEYCLMLDLEQEVFSYIACAYYHSVFKDSKYCHKAILAKLDKEIKGNGDSDLIRRTADLCNISETLLLRYRNDQCVNCKVQGCLGRVDETHGILELVGPNCDKTLFGSDDERAESEDCIPSDGDELQQFKRKYGEDYAGNYVRSLVAMVGYHPDMTFRKLKEPWDWWKETYNKPYDFQWPAELEKTLISLIFREIEHTKDNERELEVTIFSLISPFKDTCQYLMPKLDDTMYVDGAITLLAYSLDDSHSIEGFKSKLELARNEAKAISKEQNLSRTEYLWVLMRAIREKKGILPFAFGNKDIRNLTDISDALHFYATIIEAALLRYGLRRDIFSYMRDSNVFLTDFVFVSELGDILDMNNDQVSVLVSRYGHTLSATSDDVFSVALENYEPGREIDLSSITSSPYNQMIHERLEKIGGGVNLLKLKTASLRTESLETKLSSRPEKKGSETIPVETSSTVHADFNFPSEIVDDNAHLKVSMACFVRHCVKNNLFEPYTKQAWSPVDGMLYDKNNRPISAKQLAQSYQDQMTKGTLAE